LYPNPDASLCEQIPLTPTHTKTASVQDQVED